jgi:hypothetical protein
MISDIALGIALGGTLVTFGCTLAAWLFRCR